MTPDPLGGARWRLVEGDCLAALRDLPATSIDAVVTDPPYSSGGQFRGDRVRGTNDKYTYNNGGLARPEFSGDNRDQRAFAVWCALWLGECLRVATPGAPLVVFTDWRQLATTIDAVQVGGWVYRGVVPWDKTFRTQCEYVVWGSAGPMSPERPVPVLPGLYSVPVDAADKHHIAGKPTALLQRLVRICEPGGVVLDPFAGSGTTGVAALLEGFRFLGCELSAEYAAVARERLAGAAGEFTDADREQPSLFAATPTTPPRAAGETR